MESSGEVSDLSGPPFSSPEWDVDDYEFINGQGGTQWLQDSPTSKVDY